MRAKLPRFTIGKELEVDAAAVADTAHGGQTYYEMTILPVRCVTNTAMSPAPTRSPPRPPRCARREALTLDAEEIHAVRAAGSRRRDPGYTSI